jgi:hypothetical protein
MTVLMEAEFGSPDALILALRELTRLGIWWEIAETYPLTLALTLLESG